MYFSNDDDFEQEKSKLSELLAHHLIGQPEYDRRVRELMNGRFTFGDYATSPPESFTQDPRFPSPLATAMRATRPKVPVPVRTGGILIPITDLNASPIPVSSVVLRRPEEPPADVEMSEASDDDDDDLTDEEKREFEEQVRQDHAKEMLERERRDKADAARRAHAEAAAVFLRQAQRNKEEEGSQSSAGPPSPMDMSTDSVSSNGSFDSSVASSPATPKVKGLMNPLGANNCFLNVVIQSLWHMSKFRKAFLLTEKHQHKEPCVFCALKQLFSNYQFGEETALPPGLLREALSALFSSEKRFQVGELDDAAEAHDAVLESIHNSIAGGSKEKEVICEPPCVVHQSFALNTVETIECEECNEISDPLSFQEFIHYIPADALAEIKHQHRQLPMDQCIAEFHKRDMRNCPNEGCGKKAPNIRSILSTPIYLSIGLIWTKNTVQREELQSVLNAIGMEINLEKLASPNRAQKMAYRLKGFICYYGKHYVAYFLVNNEWVVFDDSSIFPVGNLWSQVVEKLLLNKHQPFVLWYEKSE